MFTEKKMSNFWTMVSKIRPAKRSTSCQMDGYTEETDGLSYRAPPPTLNTSITFNNIQHPNILRIISPNNSQTLSNTQHTRQTDPLTEQRKI